MGRERKKPPENIRAEPLGKVAELGRTPVLAVLASEPMTGEDIIREIAERSGGQIAMKPEMIDQRLHTLEETGLITSKEQDGKRVFELTPAGRERVASLPDSDATAERRGRDVGFDTPFRDAMVQLRGAVMHVREQGSPEQVERTKKILAEAFKEIDAISGGS